MEGVRLSRNDLIQNFRISQRLAVRVGALLACNVDITAAVLEAASPGSAVERMLLHPSLLEAKGALDTPALTAAARESEAERSGPFAVADRGEWRTIAFQEEQLAEAGWRHAAAEGAESTALVRAAESAVLRPEEAHEVFSPEEIARLKVQALTSAAMEDRVSALRKIRMAPMTPQDKGGVFLRVLLDPVSPARSEAIQGLEEMGFDRDTAEAVQDMLEQEGVQRTAAIERLGALLGRLTPGETQIVLRVLAQGLREFSEPAAQDRLLRVMGEAAAAIARHDDVTEEVVRLALRRVLEMPARVASRLTGFLYRLAACTPPRLESLLWSELETLREPDLRALALTLMAQLDLPADRRVALARSIVQELLRENLEELQRQKLGHNLVSLGPPALDPLLASFAAGGARERVILIRLLDMLLVDQPFTPEARNRAAARLLDGLRMADRRLRDALCHTRLLTLPDLEPRLRRQIAEALIGQLHAVDHPDLASRIGDILEHLGAEGLESAVETLRQMSARDLMADCLARIVGRAGAAVLRAGGEPPRGRLLMRHLREQVRDAKVRQGGFAYALGLLASAGIEPLQEVQADADLLLARLRAGAYPADALEALGFLAASERLDLPWRLGIAGVFASILDSTEKSEEGGGLREVDTADGPIYEFSREVAFDSDALPVVVEALERICLSPHCTPALKQQAVGHLSRVWEKVASWQVIWGPRSSAALAMALGRIGSSADTPAEVCRSIARAMCRQVGRISVVTAMRQLFTSPLEDEAFNETAEECGREMIAHWDQPETSPEEREIVLTAAARIAARPQLPARRPAVRDLRRRMTTLLLESLNQGVDWARAPLEWMRDCPTMPANLRGDIADRLRKAQALTRIVDKGPGRG
jgi:hypothetical protein